jgi:ElaB/YqjD/DUF883 family membrane-anchored ribosome-binding protein
MATQELHSRSTGADSEGLVTQVQEQVQDKAQDLKGQASAKLRKQLDTSSTDAGDQFTSLASALRRAAQELESGGKDTPAHVARQVASRVERVGGYLRDGDADAFLNDVERFARRRPWAAGGIGAVLGLVASRFLKASSGQRYTAAQSARRDRSAPPSRSGSAPGTDQGGARSALPTAGGSPNER